MPHARRPQPTAQPTAQPTVKALLEGGASATGASASAAASEPGAGPAPLLSCCMHGQPHLASLLMQYGAGLDSARNEQGTLLFLPSLASALMAAPASY